MSFGQKFNFKPKFPQNEFLAQTVYFWKKIFQHREFSFRIKLRAPPATVPRIKLKQFFAVKPSMCILTTQKSEWSRRHAVSHVSAQPLE